MNMKEELLKGLSDEQIAKLKECKTQEEILALAKEEGVELTDEQLEAVSGGICLVQEVGDTRKTCPECGSKNVIVLGDQYLLCNDCKHRWDLWLAKR